jgi:hypothetical protein
MAGKKATHCWVICKKTFSVTLVFNALLSIGCAMGILSGFYWRYNNWQPFSPFLISAALFWVLIIAALINIFPSAGLGRSLHTGRLFFHHYFYGFLVLVSSAAYVIFFTPVSLFNIFFINDTSVPVNLGRVFLLGGGALVLDDLPDVHGRIDSFLNWLKAKAGQAGKLISALQVITGTVTLYIFIAIALAMNQDHSYITIANSIVLVSTFITGITSFIFVKRKIWLNLEI